jgi:DNA-binding GntR family transcriptional regulator
MTQREHEVPRQALQSLASTLERPLPLADQVASQIRHAIVTGTLAGGTHLSVPELARQLGVSRTPAREALLILEREGLVGRRNSAGLQVLIGDTATLIGLFEMREVLEGLAARRAAERMSALDQAALARSHRRHVEVLARADLDEHAQLDAEFHALVRKAADSTALDEQLVRIERIAEVLNRALSAEEGFDARLVDIDHQAIIDAITRRDPAAAEAAARAHIRRAAWFLRSRREEGAEA